MRITSVLPALLSLAAAPAFAQAPAHHPGPPIGGPTLQQSLDAAAAAIAACKAGGQTVSVVILDPAGMTRLSEASDGAVGGTPGVAQRKAFTVLTFHLDGVPLGSRLASDKDMAAKLAARPDAFWPRPAGARQIMQHGVLLGVIGVSGSIGHKPGAVDDDACAAAGLKSLGADAS